MVLPSIVFLTFSDAIEEDRLVIFLFQIAETPEKTEIATGEADVMTEFVFYLNDSSLNLSPICFSAIMFRSVHPGIEKIRFAASLLAGR